MRAEMRWLAAGVCGVVCFVVGRPAAHAAIITGETASASSSIGQPFDRVPAHAVNDSGLSPGDDLASTPDQVHHDDPDGAMWLSTGTDFGGVDPNPSFTVDLGALYDLTGVRVFNYNEFYEPLSLDLTARGVNRVNVLVGETAPTTPLGTVDIPQATGTDDYTGTFYDLVALTGGPVRARYFMLDIESNHGGDNQFYGLSELQFDGTLVPEPTSAVVLALGGAALFTRRRRRR